MNYVTSAIIGCDTVSHVIPTTLIFLLGALIWGRAYECVCVWGGGGDLWRWWIPCQGPLMGGLDVLCRFYEMTMMHVLVA